MGETYRQASSQSDSKQALKLLCACLCYLFFFTFFFDRQTDSQPDIKHWKYVCACFIACIRCGSLLAAADTGNQAVREKALIICMRLSSVAAACLRLRSIVCQARQLQRQLCHQLQRRACVLLMRLSSVAAACLLLARKGFLAANLQEYDEIPY